MAKAYVAPILSAALKVFKKTVREHEERAREEGKRLVVFCEDRLSLVAERAICEEVGGTFSVSVFTLSRFLVQETGKPSEALTSRGSAMAIRRLIEANAPDLKLFRRLSTPDAAQEVYDTIALLYSSGVSAEDISDVDGGSELLKRKLHDISLLYKGYFDFLAESGAVDRNEYLRVLPDIIKGSERIKGADVLFLGFNAFTSTVRECVRAAMRTARETYGIFIGDRKGVRLYQNEALADFIGVAQSLCVGAEIEYVPSYLPAEAELLRLNIFNPDSLNPRLKNAIGMDISPDEYGVKDNAVSVTEAMDEEEELHFIAAHILKCVAAEGVRPHRISVMLPDLPRYQPMLERVFNEYRIPFYVDRRYPLAPHPVCSFALDYISCACDGMRLNTVLAVAGNPLFCDREEGGACDRRAIDFFVNYMLRAASSRGGIARAVDEAVCADMDKGGAGGVYEAVCDVREKFLAGRRLIPEKADGGEFCAAIRNLLKTFDIDKKLAADSEDELLSKYPSAAAMSARACGAFLSVLDEAEKLTKGEVMTARAFSKILKSGLAAAEISLIPPKQGAVFVGDISATANAGSDVIFAAGLTDGVPKASQDTSILTDGELTSVEKLSRVSPKISQLNRRVRELTALNVCAFSKRLYLVYPLRSGGEECSRSEIIDYACALFKIGGKGVSPVAAGDDARERGNLPYYFSNARAALAEISQGGGDSAVNNTLYALLKEAGEKDDDVAQALGGLGGNERSEKSFSGGKQLYGNRISPTALETFFSCPYKCFMQQGLRLEERPEGEIRPLDSGNFIHSVLEETAKHMGEFAGAEECAAAAEEIAKNKLKVSPYKALAQDGRGLYTAECLVREARAISGGMYSQLAHSSFKISGTEEVCSISLGDGFSVGGRIDRIDSCGDIVRVIDYKTGYHDNSAESYYMGLKLQLPLYLSAAAEGKRAAGAYYFPAKIEYSSRAENTFCLKGFMDGSADIVKLSDDGVQDKQRSAYVDAYLNGRKIEGAMEREEFSYFLNYSRYIAQSGAESMTGGYVSPSPTGGVCKRCPYSGCCAYDCESDGERELKKVNCSAVAEIARARKGKEGD